MSGGGGLEDVNIYRAEDQPTPSFFPDPAAVERMVFELGGRTYPASLVDLPCPVESHRTFDRVVTYKSADVAQVSQASATFFLRLASPLPKPLPLRPSFCACPLVNGSAPSPLHSSVNIVPCYFRPCPFRC